MMAKISKKARFIAMLTVTFLFFLAEILTGYLTNSMALVADSFHMFSDVLSILIGYLAVHYSDKKSDRNTYDWARAGVLGAMANAVFLMALVFTIILNAIQRIIIVEPITKPLVILGVGAAGLVVNIFGLFLFGGHAHGHDHHGHQHGHSHDAHRPPDVKIIDDKGHGEHVSTLSQHSTRADASQLNMQAVFLHVLGDALGSVVVIISALIIYFVEDDWRYYVDPAMSLVTSGIISWFTIPLLRRTAMILLQNPPTNVDVDKVRENVARVPGVISIHDLHVWQLSGDCAIATVHIVLRHDCCFTEVAQALKKIFHEVDVHSTTIQPEFIGASDEQLSLSTATSCTSLPSSSRDIDLSFAPCSDLGVHEETDSDTKCLLQCVSQECVSKMCCDGVKKKSIVSNKQRKSAKSYENPGYSGADNNNLDIAILKVQDIRREECAGD